MRWVCMLQLLFPLLCQFWEARYRASSSVNTECVTQTHATTTTRCLFTSHHSTAATTSPGSAFTTFASTWLFPLTLLFSAHKAVVVLLSLSTAIAIALGASTSWDSL